MSQIQRPVRFVEHPARRAPTVSWKEWLKHKAELCRLYQHMTLEELVEHMKEEYGFEASIRQYTHKFSQWHLRKYRTEHEHFTSNDHVPSTARLDPLPPTHSSQSNGTSSSKRRRSFDKYADRPAARQRKRQKSQHNSVHRLATIGLQFASTGQASPPSSSPLNERSSADIPNVELLSPTFVEPPPVVTDNAPIESAAPSSSNASPRFFDSSRPMHTFTGQDLGDMEMAAYFLRALGFDSDAFELFTILLKYLKEENLDWDLKKTLALIDCGRSSFLSSQIAIAQSELRKSMERSRDGLTGVEHFLHQMLLAELCLRSNDERKEEYITELSDPRDGVDDKVLDLLPDSHRFYDLVTYYYLIRCLDQPRSLIGSQTNSRNDPPTSELTSQPNSLLSRRFLQRRPLYVRERIGWLEDAFPPAAMTNADKPEKYLSDKEHLQFRMLERIPGPFELRHGSFRNPCLKSCLKWCETQLACIEQLPEGWTSLQSDDKDYVYWTDHIGLYCSLWGRWQSQRRGCIETQHDQWMSHSDKLMGIHPAELLSVVCGMVMLAAPLRKHPLVRRHRSSSSGYRSSPHHIVCSDLITRAVEGITALLSLSDRDKGSRFLETFSLLSTLFNAPPLCQVHDMATLFATVVNASRGREAYAESARAFVRGHIQKDLNIILPDIQRDVKSDSAGGGLSELLSDVSLEAAAFLPTLVSSICSSDLSAMRLLKDGIKKGSPLAEDECDMSTPLKRVNSASHDSARIMAHLSNAMASSLSLTPSQATRNATLDAMASVLGQNCR